MGANKSNCSHEKFFKEVVALRRVWSVFVSLCIVAAVLLVAAFSLTGYLGFYPYAVTSGSMEPEYPVGSMIYVEKVPAEQIRVGDAITFYMPGTDIVATHQVYEIDETNKQFRTQGINNRDKDGNILHDAEPVDFDSYIGKPVVCIPYLGYVNRFCTTAPGYYYLLAVAVVVIVVSFFIDAIPQKKTSRNGKYEK